VDAIESITSEPDILAIEAVLQITDTVQMLARCKQKEYGLEIFYVVLVLPSFTL